MDLILKPYTKFEFKSTKQTRRRRRGESLPGKTVAPDLQNRWHRFWAVSLFSCEGTSPEIPEISPEIPYFPETPEKTSEIPGITDKFVLSVIFQDSPIHPPPPPSRRHQDPFNWYQSLVLRFKLNRLKFKDVDFL
jgi:hypothetical protein